MTFLVIWILSKQMEHDMTKGSSLKLLTLFSLPLFFGNLFQQFYSMVDTIIVGKFVGVGALAALGCTSGFSFMVVGFAMGLTSGFGVLISQAYGAKDYKQMRQLYSMSILLSILMGVIISVIFTIFSKNLLLMINTPLDILEDANTYILTIYVGLILVVFYNLFAAILRAVGDSKSPLIFIIISSVLNVVLDLLFVLVFNLGCLGVGIATVFSQGISAFISYFYINRKFDKFRFEKGDFKINTHLCTKLLKLGIPGALQFSVCAIGVIIVQIAINSFGSDSIAAYSIGGKIEGIVTQFFPALGMAISTYAGQNYGSGDYERIRKGFRSGLYIVIIGALISFFIVYFFSPYIVKLFLAENASQIVVDQSLLYARIVSFFFIPLGFIFLFRTGCQGLGSASIPMISSILELVFRIIAAFTLPYFFGYYGICFASPFAWAAAGFILPFFYFHRLKKIKKQLQIPNASVRA